MAFLSCSFWKPLPNYQPLGLQGWVKLGERRMTLKSSYGYINFFCGAFIMKELEAIKARVKEMEEEAEKLKEMQKQVEESIMSPTAGQPTCKNFVCLKRLVCRCTAQAW